MAKRARYDGPSEVLVFHPDDTYLTNPLDSVKPGGMLSADVPASIRDELLSRDDWTEVQDSSGSSSTSKKES